MKREDWIDSAKGRLIFMVVLGHALQYFMCGGKNYWYNPFFFFIYSFHMPLFSLLSGYLFYGYSQKVSFKDIVLLRFMQIMIPCFVWALINYLLGVAIGRHQNPGLIGFIKFWINSNWYLWAMFYCSLTMLICVTAKKYKYLMAGIVVLLCLLTPDVLNSIDLKMMFPFFLIGYAVKDYNIQSYIKNFSKTKVCVWILGGGLAYILTIKFLINERDIMTWECCSIDNFSVAICFVKKFIWNIISCAFILGLFKVCDYRKVKFIRELGKETLGIYMLQTFFFENLMEKFIVPLTFPIGVRYLVVILISVAITGVCFGMVKLIRKNRYTRNMLLRLYKLKKI